MKTTPTLFAAFSLTLLAPVLPAQTKTPAPIPVQPLLDKVAAAYRNVKALSFTVETTEGVKTATSKVVFMKPDKLTATVTMSASAAASLPAGTPGKMTVHIVSDGTSLFSDETTSKNSYSKEPYTDFKGMINSLAAHGGAGIGLLPMLLTSANAEKQIVPGKPTSLKKLPDAKVGTDVCDLVEAIVPRGGASSRVLFAFGKQDHLLRKLTLGGTKDPKPEIVEIYSNVSTTPTTADTAFHYTPAAGAKLAEAPAEPAEFDPRLKVGADPLPIAGNDLDGKAVSLDQYKGKVVLLDFWATWCGPCVEEIPNVVAAYGKYHGQGFEVVGISLDQENSKDKVVKFTQDQKMPWRQIYDGKYWKAENAVAFGVQAIPFTLLIGKDGKIAAVGARGEALAPAIEAALKK